MPRRMARAHRPVVSMMLIGVCSAILVLQEMSPTFANWSYIHGAQQQDLVLLGESYRLVSAAFLHAGLTHLLFNMWALYALGVELERRVGGLPFVALYVAAAVGGGAAYQLFGGDAPVVGASGAIFGLFGSWLAVAWRARGSAAGRAGLRQMVTLLGINLALPLFIPGIAWQAHLGGFAVGVVVTGVWMMPGVQRAATRTAVALAAAAGGYAAAVSGVA